MDQLEILRYSDIEGGRLQGQKELAAQAGRLIDVYLDPDEPDDDSEDEKFHVGGGAVQGATFGAAGRGRGRGRGMVAPAWQTGGQRTLDAFGFTPAQS